MTTAKKKDRISRILFVGDMWKHMAIFALFWPSSDLQCAALKCNIKALGRLKKCKFGANSFFLLRHIKSTKLHRFCHHRTGTSAKQKLAGKATMNFSVGTSELSSILSPGN